MSVYRKNLLQMLAPDFDRNAHADAGGFDIVQSSPIGNRAPRFIGEELFNETGKVFYKGTGLGVNDWYTGSGGGGLSDGDYGDISVTSGGTAMNLDNDAVTNAKLANMATATIKGRTTAGTGDPEDLTAAQVRALLALVVGTDVAAQSHVGAGGSAHANAVAAGAAGFMTGSDKTKLDGVASGATANDTDANLKNRANHTGTQALATLAQSSATTGQVAAWSGSAWAPVSPTLSPFAAIRAAATSGNITVSDAGGAVLVSGSGNTQTLVETSFSAGQMVWIQNIDSTNSVTIASANGINQSGTTSFVLGPQQCALVSYRQGTAPRWFANFTPTLSLSANQMAVMNSGGTALEARTQKIGGSGWCLEVTANGTYQLGMWADVPVTLIAVRCRTLAGTASIQIRKAGSAINGFASAQAITSTVGSVTSTESFAQDNILDVVVTSASSLTGIFMTPLGVRTGN